MALLTGIMKFTIYRCEQNNESGNDGHVLLPDLLTALD